MDLCEQLGCEPVICGNIGSGTVKEMSDWVLKGTTSSRVSGEIITAPTMNAYNDFGKPEAVNIQPFAGAQLQNGVLTVSLPARSIVTLEVN